jgi:hypothetical protein
VAKERGEDTPTESDSLEEEGEVTPPSQSPPHTTPPLFGDIFSQQVGIMISERRPKMNPDKDRVDCQLGSATPPRAGNAWPKGDEHCTCVDEINSPSLDFTSPIGIRGCDGKVVLVEPRGVRALTQESPWQLPGGVLPVCVWSRLLSVWFFAPPIFVPKLKV